MAGRKGTPTGRCQGCNHPERVRIERVPFSRRLTGAMGPRFRRDLEAIANYWAGRRTPPGPIRPGYGALNFQNVPLIAPSK